MERGLLLDQNGKLLVDSLEEEFNFVADVLTRKYKLRISIISMDQQVFIEERGKYFVHLDPFDHPELLELIKEIEKYCQGFIHSQYRVNLVQYIGVLSNINALLLKLDFKQNMSSIAKTLRMLRRLQTYLDVLKPFMEQLKELEYRIALDFKPMMSAIVEKWGQ